jgi:hypothetical protein
MDKKTVFVKTDKGESEVGGQSDALYGDAKRILLLIDDESTVGDISKRAAPSLRETLHDMLQELVDGGYIRDMRAPVTVPQKSTLKFASPAFKMATPKVAAPPIEAKNSAPAPSVTANAVLPSKPIPAMTMPTMPTMPSPPGIKQEERTRANDKGDLDFSFITSGSTQSKDAVAAAIEKVQAETLATARQEAEAARLKAEQSAQIEAAARAVKLKAYEEAKEKAKIEVAARARIEAEARGKNEAEAARLKAEQEALKTRSELEATQARVEAEVRARIEAEARIKKEVEAARLKAEREAEKIRLELEAAKAKAEMEMRHRLEAEARAKAEAEARLKREAEAERLRIEKERAELEVARVKAEAEVRMREEAERRVRAEVEARIRREEEAERLRVEKERAELEAARVKAETEQRMRAETEVRVRAEVEARLKAEALAQQSALSSTSEEALGRNLPPEVQIDPAEKLRQSFAESFGPDKEKQKASPLNFKLDTFSLAGPGEKPGEIVHPKKPNTPPGGGSKVKAAIEQRAQKEAEDQRIKAEQDSARLIAEHEQAARIKAEQETIRLKAEHEAYLLKEEREKAEAETQKLADQQARQWEDAQRRAASQAQAEKERLAKQVAETQAKSQKKSARVHRKPLPIGKMVASLFVLILIAVIGLPYIWPLDEYIAPLEKEISSQFNQPIHIKKIHLALLPLPKLELHTLTMGSGQELKVGEVVLHFDFSALFAPTKSIDSMELSDVSVAGASLDKALVWLQAVGANEKYPVARMELHEVRLVSDEIKLPSLTGRADFDAQGKFSKADLKSEDGKFGLELQLQQQRLQLELNIHESNLPILPDIKFNDLSVNGVVGNGEIIFSDFFAHVHGGTLTGKGLLNWSNGWKLQGQINAKSLELQSMFPNFGVAGELYGDISVSMYGAALSQLDKDPHMEGTFEAKNGVISKLDIETIARFGSRQGTSARTNFSELTGTLKADRRGQRFYLNKIDAGVVSGSGFFEVDAKQQLSGKLLVDIKGDAKGNVPLQLSGSPAAPLLQPGH